MSLINWRSLTSLLLCCMTSTIVLAQTDNQNFNSLILVNKKTNNSKIIMVSEGVTIYLQDGNKMDGLISGITDSSFIMSEQNILFSSVSRIKHKSESIRKARKTGLWLTVECLAFAAVGGIIMIVTPNVEVDDVLDLPEWEFAGLTLVIVGTYQSLVFLPLIFTPYKQYIIGNKWLISPYKTISK